MAPGEGFPGTDGRGPVVNTFFGSSCACLLTRAVVGISARPAWCLPRGAWGTPEFATRTAFVDVSHVAVVLENRALD